jgi:ABC-type nickel/cobalt efflux system permease component RcnA
MQSCLAVTLAIYPVASDAHPMGNFSVSHYSRLTLGERQVRIEYVLDLAELPTLELLQKWNLGQTSPRTEMEARAMAAMREWTRNLTLTENGRPVRLQLLDAKLTVADGAANMPVVRIAAHLTAPAAGGKISYEDRNYKDRAGWKEVVVRAEGEAKIENSSAPSEDRTNALTAYPQDATAAPPQVLTASVDLKTPGGVETAAALREKGDARAAVVPMEASPTAPDDAKKTPVPFTSPKADAPGTVVRGDYLSDLMSKKELGLGVVLIGMCVAFGLGAMHAFSPGHGKTMVAAYLVGTKGTFKHAVFLGGMVTFTHTISVFALAFVTKFLSAYILPERLYPILGTISGLTIVWIGAMLFVRRLRTLRRGSHSHSHEHVHSHGHDAHDHHTHVAHEHAHVHAHPVEKVHAHVHEHQHVQHVHALADGHSHDHGHSHSHEGHSHDHGHSHSHEPHSHSHGHDHTHAHHDHNHDHEHHHGPGGHTHVIEGDVSLKSLIALGASGGLVPCPSGLVLLLSAIAIGRLELGVLLLIAFSAGLAVVLTVIGLLVVYAKSWLPDSSKTAQNPAFRIIPVLSAAAVFLIGVVMTGVSLGWITPNRFIG